MVFTVRPPRGLVRGVRARVRRYAQKVRSPVLFLTGAALVEGLEGVALIGFAAYVGVETAVGSAADPSTAAALTITTVVLGLGAVIAAVGLYRGRKWARGPAVVTQIFALPVAGSFFQAGRFLVGALLAAAAVLGIVLLFHPATTRQLLGQHPTG